MDICVPNASYAAQAWAAQHPSDDWTPCCYGSIYDPGKCTCWQPVYATAQAAIRPPESPQDLRARTGMCGDCAYRKGSPERADAYDEERLLALPHRGELFWCHDGMRRPTHWEHPDGRTVPAHPDDWHPAQQGNFLFQADGTPALLCAGWTHRALRARATGTWTGPGTPPVSEPS